MDTLSEDILDDEFVNVFRASYFQQYLLGFLRANFKYKFVTSPSLIYRICSTTIWVFNLIAIYDCIYHCSTGNSVVLAIAIYTVTSSIVALQNNLFNDNRNSQLYVKLQKIDRGLNMKHSNDINRRLTIATTTFTITISFIYLLWVVTINVLLMVDAHPASIVALTLNGGLYFELSIFCSIILFIIIRIEYINTALESELTDNKFRGNIYNFVWMVNLFKRPGEKMHCDRNLVLGMYHIADALADLINVYQFPLLLFTSYLMIWDLVVTQSFISTVKYQNSWDVSLQLLFALVVNVAVMLVMCLFAYALTSKLETTETLCKKIKSSHYEGISRRVAKQILLLLEVKYDISVYGIFSLNFSLLLKLFAIAASYTIFLFQFTLL